MQSFEKYTFIVLSIILLIACKETTCEPVDYVDPFIGTGFHGHTYPGASAPFGAVQLSPDTRFGNWDACSGYHYSDSVIIGFSHTHLSGTGCADLGDILFHPTTKEIKPVQQGYIFDYLLFSHKEEKASPGYYSVDFKQEGIKAELTATTHVGMHRYTYAKGKEVNLIIDMSHLLTEEVIDSVEIKQTTSNEISGMRRTQGWVPNQYVFFVARFSKDFQSVLQVNDGKILGKDERPSTNNRQLFIKFGQSDDSPLVACVGLSVVSEENARQNLQDNIAGFDFDQVCQSVRDQWNKELSRIKVEGGSRDDMVNFYTAAYHARLMPSVMNDVNGQYRRHDMKIAQLQEGKKYYSAFSIWDTFRAWNPLQILLDTVLVNDMINSYLEMYDALGELPIWPLFAGETYTMIGYHSVSVIADAYMKGIRGFNIHKAYEAMKGSSEINKKGSDYYINNGFIPSNIKRESVSCLLEYAYDDWCVAQVAKELGEMDDYEKYTRRALSYINVFDGHTGFFRGKQSDGNWDSPFNSFEPGRAYTEATAWQYRFFVPHDVNGMVQLFGGKDPFTSQLDSLFIVEDKVHGDMVDITGLIGQYAQGNEPSHHMAYLYNYVGQPWKTQEMTRRILKEMYHPTPEGISGNEDCGQMSAWYILSSLGLYAVCPGSNQFIITTPLFEKATVLLANGKTLTITANNPRENSYIDKLEFNGREITSNFIIYDQLMEGGELIFILTESPSKQRGIGVESYPYSLTEGTVVSIPYTTKELNLFIDATEVDLGSATAGTTIYYTLDGSEPDESTFLYKEPFEITDNVIIKAKGYKEGYAASRTFVIEATKAVMAKGINAQAKENGLNYHYYEGYYQHVDEIEKSELKERGKMLEPSIKNAREEDHFGYIFSGIIYVPEDGVYEFITRSDDGSVLLINNMKVVDNDGSHAAVIATGRVALSKGYHHYKLLYFEDYEGEHLSWSWKKPSSEKYEAIPAENLFIN